ncbi:MAG TPA: hypothetical protein PK591_03070 [Ignavibacteriales bacterium]|nr:hypothetical protein [Ignavibacteriales bacterium]
MQNNTINKNCELLKNINNLLLKNNFIALNTLLDKFLEVIANIENVQFTSISFIRNDKLNYYTVKTIPNYFENDVEKINYQLFIAGILTSSLNTKQVLFRKHIYENTVFNIYVFPLFANDEALGNLIIGFNENLDVLSTELLNIITLANFTLSSYILNLKKNDIIASNEKLLQQQIVDSNLENNKVISELKNILSYLPIGLLILNAETDEILYSNYYTENLSKLDNSSTINSYRNFFIVDYVNGEFIPIEHNFSSTPKHAFFKDCYDNLIPILFQSFYLKGNKYNYIIEIFIDNSIQKYELKELKDNINKQEEIFVNRNELLKSLSREILLYLNDMISTLDIIKVDDKENTELLEIINNSSNQLKLLLNNIIDRCTVFFTDVNIDISGVNINDFIKKITFQIKPLEHDVKINFVNKLNINKLYKFDEWLIVKLLYYLYNLIVSLQVTKTIEIIFLESDIDENKMIFKINTLLTEKVNHTLTEIFDMLLSQSIKIDIEKIDYKAFFFISSIIKITKLLHLTLDYQLKDNQLSFEIEL